MTVEDANSIREKVNKKYGLDLRAWYSNSDLMGDKDFTYNETLGHVKELISRMLERYPTEVGGRMTTDGMKRLRTDMASEQFLADNK
jgi:hypothetical protein